MPLVEIFLLFIILIILVSFIFITFLDFLNFLKGRPPFLPSTKWEVNRILSIYNFEKQDKVVDLGSGDARILLELGKKGVRCVGYEINPLLVLWSRIKIYSKGFSKKITIKKKDYLSEDLSAYNVFIIYGIKEIMPNLEKKLLKEAKKGSIVISNKFMFPDLKQEKNISTTYLYKI